MENFNKEINSVMFSAGDIVDFTYIQASSSTKIQNMRKVILAQKPYKLIVVKKIEDDSHALYLVAICRKYNAKTQLVVNTNVGKLYIKSNPTFLIDEASLCECASINFTISKNSVVREILRARGKKAKQDLNKIEKKRIAAMKKRNLKKQPYIEQQKLEKQFQDEYALAVINNDRKTMQKIKKIVGYAPDEDVGVKSKKGVPYKRVNPKPYNGGRFTPK